MPRTWHSRSRRGGGHGCEREKTQARQSREWGCPLLFRRVVVVVVILVIAKCIGAGYSHEYRPDDNDDHQYQRGRVGGDDDDDDDGVRLPLLTIS